jgi:hypothetical protein
MNRRALLLSALCFFVFAVTANPCRDLAACCRVFDFEAPSANGAVPFSGNTVAVPARNNSLWWPTGISVSVDQSPGGSGSTPYPLGLFDASRLPALGITGASELYSASQHLVLAAFQFFDTALLKGTQTLRFNLWKQPACVATVTTMRSISMSYRQSVRMVVSRLDPASGALVDVASHSVAWKVGQSQNTDTYEFSNLDIDQLRVELFDMGYGALASVEVCYHAPQGYDGCSQCGGDGVGCASPGQSCNTGMSGVCALGTYDFDLRCVPNMSNMPELCNGVDDNCNGVVDEGDFGVWTCGVGECARTVPQCQNGVMVASSACVPGQPSAEVCDGKDNNCNGQVDEGGVCVASSPSPSATPQPSPSASAAPAAPFLLPLLSCVRALPDSGGQYEARFGYSLFGPGATTVDIPVGASNLLVRGGSVTDGQTTHFVAGAPVSAAFSVLFSAAQMVQWTVALPAQASQTALATWQSNACDSDAVLSLEAVQPLFQGCVTMLGSRCTVQLSYFNPNEQTVELPAESGSNWFEPEPADRRQPRVFWPGLVQAVEEVEFDCSVASWTLNWTVALGAQRRSAVASAASLC